MTILADLPSVEVLLAIFAVIPMMLFVNSLCLRFLILRDWLLHFLILQLNGHISLFLAFLTYTYYSPLCFLVMLQWREMLELENYSLQ
jgi:hypothetical protein